MTEKMVKCPKCGNKVIIEVSPGKTTIITCSNCGTKGKYSFTPEQKDFVKTNKDAIIEVNNLSKNFNGFKAVDNISFRVEKGDIFGFLGPNGAGKTTTINMLTTIIKPTNGSLKICNFDLSKNPLDAKKKMGFMPDVPGFYDEMKAVDILNYFAEFYKIPKEKRKVKIDKLFKMMKLSEFENKKVKTYSRGMKQKLGFASSLLNDPEILILDEPTNGLDPATIHFFREVLRDLNEKGVTIFLSSHILSEVQAVCNRVCIINKGKIVAVDSIDNLSKMINKKGSTSVIISYEDINENAINEVKKIPGVLSVKQDDENKKLDIEIDFVKSIVPDINIVLVKQGIRIKGIKTKETSLEDIFLSLTGGEQGE